MWNQNFKCNKNNLTHSTTNNDGERLQIKNKKKKNVLSKLHKHTSIFSLNWHLICLKITYQTTTHSTLKYVKPIISNVTKTNLFLASISYSCYFVVIFSNLAQFILYVFVFHLKPEQSNYHFIRCSNVNAQIA
jgi:hypothetical protein